MAGIDTKTGSSLGETIRSHRLQAQLTLREMARRVEISASHQSDIEHGRRMPSDQVLRKIAHQLYEVGGRYQALRALKPQLEEDLDEWVTADRHVRQLLREWKDSGLSGRRLLERYREDLIRKREGE